MSIRAASVEVRRARSDEERAAALALRRRVFCLEQGVPVALEVDGRDGEALHLVAMDGDEVVGTVRVLLDAGTMKLGRLAVEPQARRRGLGRQLLALAEREARAVRARRIALHAQRHAQALYTAAGYRPCGRPFREAGIEHVAMEKRLA